LFEGIITSVSGLFEKLDKLSFNRSVKGNVNYVRASKENYLKIAAFLKENGFKRFLTVGVVDWLEKGSFEVYFIVHNMNNIYVKVSTEIPREKPEIPSLSDLWPNAAMHERESWELFGIKFSGNPMLKPLFLEDWNGPPPFKKDFNWREYVKQTFKLPQAGGDKQ